MSFTKIVASNIVQTIKVLELHKTQEIKLLMIQTTCNNARIQAQKIKIKPNKIFLKNLYNIKNL
jgi:hypothetical protein